MADERNNPQFEMEIELPTILPDSLQLDNGTILSVGDNVHDDEFGMGTILRFGVYDSEPVGPFAYIDFGNNAKKEILVAFVKKVS
jgi:hypothetical protein